MICSLYTLQVEGEGTSPEAVLVSGFLSLQDSGKDPTAEICIMNEKRKETPILKISLQLAADKLKPWNWGSLKLNLFFFNLKIKMTYCLTKVNNFSVFNNPLFY